MRTYLNAVVAAGAAVAFTAVAAGCAGAGDDRAGGKPEPTALTLTMANGFYRPEDLQPFADEYKMNYPVLVGLGHENIQEAYGPMWGIPVTVIIDREGKIAKKQSGIRTKEQIEREIKALLDT